MCFDAKRAKFPPAFLLIVRIEVRIWEGTRVGEGSRKKPEAQIIPLCCVYAL